EVADLGREGRAAGSIELINQGSEAAQSIVVVDYIPAGLTLNDSAWTETTGGLATTTYAGTLAAGAIETLEITFTVADSATGTLANVAEIAEAKDDENKDFPDGDSTFDDDSINDGAIVDNEINGSMGDEDDHDIAAVRLNGPDRFDLALRKRLASGQNYNVNRGDKVNFTLEVFNQGSEPLETIKVYDYIPNGMSMVLADNPDWTQEGVADQACCIIAGPIPPGSSATIGLVLQVDADAPAGECLRNVAEIGEAYDEDGFEMTDDDSTWDNDPDNDGRATNNEINNLAFDEDDHDFECVEVNAPGAFDLALRKTLAIGQPLNVNPGDSVTFTLEVFNQGAVTARNIRLVDYIPQGLTLTDPLWTETAGVATYTIAGPLSAGTTQYVNVTFLVNGQGSKTISNQAEIADATDGDGQPVTDVDSVADTDQGNDGFAQDNEIGNVNGDQDDHDLAIINMAGGADLASISGTIWFDADQNGQFDATESVSPGVPVMLLDVNGDPTGLSATTDSSGNYLFSGLIPGTYFVKVVPPPGQVISPQNQGSDDAIDSDTDQTTALTSPISLDPGEIELDWDTGLYIDKPTSWNEWIAKSMGATGSPTGNADGDLYDDLMEYALCLHPGSGTQGGFCVEPDVDGSMCASFQRPVGVTGVTYTVEVSNALAASGWTDLAGVTPDVMDNGNGTETVIFCNLQEMAPLSPAYGLVRLRVELASPAATSYSPAFGWTETQVALQCETFADPYLNKPFFAGRAFAVSGNMITIDTASGAIETLDTAGTYYIEVIDGTAEGQRFDVASASGTTITVDLNSPNNTAAAVPANLVGSRFVLRMHKTVGDSFDVNQFVGTNDPTTADRLLFFSGNGFESVFLLDLPGLGLLQWTDESDSGTGAGGFQDVGRRILPPCEGFFVHPRNGQQVVRSFGMIRQNRFCCPLRAGYNLISGGWPTDQSPMDRAMTSTNGFVG
ncbi:MAG: SdrD B-like domain-containing protein, partial [Verrucomicrobiota bacterium]